MVCFLCQGKNSSIWCDTTVNVIVSTHIWTQFPWKCVLLSLWSSAQYRLIGKCWQHYDRNQNWKKIITASNNHNSDSLDWYVNRALFGTTFRLIDLGKLQIKTEHRDKREYMLNPAVRKVKNKSGVIETRVFTCPECSEEYCNGRTCLDFNYDLYTRIVPKEASVNKAKLLPGSDTNAVNAKKNALKKGSKSTDADKRKRKKRHRSKSPGKKSTNQNKK